MPGKTQEQRAIEVRMLDGAIGGGVATGNNAAWLCGCGKILIGRTFEAEPKPRQLVQCPECGNKYHLFPENGECQKRAEYVREIKDVHS